MLTYKRSGFGKVGYIISTYTIENNYKINLNITISKETEEENISITNIPLTNEEISIIKQFQKEITNRYKKALYEEIEEKYEQIELYFQNEKINDEYLQKKLGLLIELICNNHKELSSSIISSLYENKCKKLYYKMNK